MLRLSRSAGMVGPETGTRLNGQFPLLDIRLTESLITGVIVEVCSVQRNKAACGITINRPRE